MNWITIYIAGKPNFQNDVWKRLEKSGLPVMSGNLGGTINKRTHDLYWLPESVSLREFKHAIGWKLIWRYRLRFYTQLEAFMESQNAGAKNSALKKGTLAWSPGSSVL